MSDKPRSKHIAFGLASMACPFIAFAIIYTYQVLAYSQFWASLDISDDAGRAAGVMMSFSQFVQIIMALSAGCFAGLLLALRSYRLQPRRLGIGLMALVLNGFPLLFLLLLWAKGIASGL